MPGLPHILYSLFPSPRKTEITFPDAALTFRSARVGNLPLQSPSPPAFSVFFSLPLPWCPVQFQSCSHWFLLHVGPSPRTQHSVEGTEISCRWVLCPSLGHLLRTPMPTSWGPYLWQRSCSILSFQILPVFCFH